jgi:hypothetical protein
MTKSKSLQSGELFAAIHQHDSGWKNQQQVTSNQKQATSHH